MSHWTDKPNPEFEQWWATKTAAGYQYGREALENVRFGFEGAQSMRWQLIDTAPKDRRWCLWHSSRMVRSGVSAKPRLMAWGGTTLAEKPVTGAHTGCLCRSQ